MVRRLPAPGIRAAFRWQRISRQPLRVDRAWMKNLKFPIKQNPIDEPQSTRAANIWSSYLGHASKLDHDLVERWKGDMDGILIFAGLFSAVVTTFIVETYKLLQPDNTQVSAELLVRVVAALENTSAADVAATVSVDSPPATTISLWINCLWFISLLFSLTCALIATLVQQWSREYLQSTERRASLTQRARFRAYFAKGVDRFGADLLVGCIPLLLHFAVLLFIVGFVLFGFTVHNVLAYVNLAVAILAGLAYGFLTLVPVFVYACPYKTPLSNMLQRAITAVQSALGSRRGVVGPIQRLPVEAALSKNDTPSSLEMDKDIIQWTMDTWTDDHDLTDANLEALFGALPDVVQPVRKKGLLEEAATVVQTLLFDGAKVGHEIPRLLRTCTGRIKFEPMQFWQTKRAESCLPVLLLLVKLAGSEQLLPTIREEIAERCLYPALEDVVLLSQLAGSHLVRRSASHCVILLVGLILRHYRECLKKVEADIEDSPTVFTQATRIDVRELFRIRNRLNVVIQPYVSTAVGNGKNMHISRDNPLQIIADQLATDEVADPGFGDIDDLMSFVLAQLVRVKDAYRLFHLTAGMITLREAGLFPDRVAEEEDNFEAVCTPLDWEEPSKYDEEEAIVNAMRGMLYLPLDDPSSQPTTSGTQVEEQHPEGIPAPPFQSSPTEHGISTEPANANRPSTPRFHSDPEHSNIYSSPLSSESSFHGSESSASSGALTPLVITDEPSELSAYDERRREPPRKDTTWTTDSGMSFLFSMGGGWGYTARAKEANLPAQSSVPSPSATPRTPVAPTAPPTPNELPPPDEYPHAPADRPGWRRAGFWEFFINTPEATKRIVQRNMAVFRRTEVVSRGSGGDRQDGEGRVKEGAGPLLEAPVEVEVEVGDEKTAEGTKARLHWARLAKRVRPRSPVASTHSKAGTAQGRDDTGDADGGGGGGEKSTDCQYEMV